MNMASAFSRRQCHTCARFRGPRAYLPTSVFVHLYLIILFKVIKSKQNPGLSDNVFLQDS